MHSRMDNGGADGWAVLDRIIHEAPAFLKPHGRPEFSFFGFLGAENAQGRLRAAGLAPHVLAREERPIPRIAREQLEHIRSMDVEAILPAGRQRARDSSFPARRASQ